MKRASGLHLSVLGIHAQRGREHADFAERIAVAQAVDQCAIAAHGDAGNERILPPVRQRQQLTRHLHDLLAHVAAVVGVALLVIDVEGIVAVDHHNGDAMHRGVQSEVGKRGRLQRPAGISVQKVQRAIRRGYVVPVVIIGQEHTRIDAAHQHVRTKVQVEVCHGKITSCCVISGLTYPKKKVS